MRCFEVWGFLHAILGLTIWKNKLFGIQFSMNPSRELVRSAPATPLEMESGLFSKAFASGFIRLQN